MYVFVVIIVVKQMVLRYRVVLMCIFSFHGCKNRTYSWRSKYRFFQNAYLMVMSAETLATTKVKIANIYALVRRNIMIYMENYIKLIFVTNSVVFVI